MKVETTISIEADLLEQFEIAAKNYSDHSEIYERALREYLPNLKRQSKRKLSREEEIELINRYADKHREEILENLEYQIEL